MTYDLLDKLSVYCQTLQQEDIIDPRRDKALFLYGAREALAERYPLYSSRLRFGPQQRVILGSAMLLAGMMVLALPLQSAPGQCGIYCLLSLSSWPAPLSFHRLFAPR